MADCVNKPYLDNPRKKKEHAPGFVAYRICEPNQTFSAACTQYGENSHTQFMDNLNLTKILVPRIVLFIILVQEKKTPLS